MPKLLSRLALVAAAAVKGKVDDVATFGGRSVGLHIRQTDLDFKRWR